MDKINSIFDVLGPIMIGPSSSHTAGAARLGKIARYAANRDVVGAKIYLHGSFAETADGHGTKKALVAGILGMEPHDERLKLALDIAKDEGIDISFEKITIDGAHPNTARFEIYKSGGEIVRLTGTSIGGGAVIVTELNGFDVEITGDYYTMITKHNDKKGIISRVTTMLAENNVNIGNMKVKRNHKSNIASMIIETDDLVSATIVEKIRRLDEMIAVIEIMPIREK